MDSIMKVAPVMGSMKQAMVISQYSNSKTVEYSSMMPVCVIKIWTIEDINIIWRKNEKNNNNNVQHMTITNSHEKRKWNEMNDDDDAAVQLLITKGSKTLIDIYLLSLDNS